MMTLIRMAKTMSILTEEKQQEAVDVDEINTPGEEEKFVDRTQALEQIKKEITLSRDYVKDKRVEWRSRFKLYNNQRKQKDKLGDTSIFNVMSTMLAIYYSDELQVSFQGRELGDQTLASNIENTAKFDYDEMEMEIVNYSTQWDRLFFGVGIRQCSEWDNNTKTPIVRSLSTLTWLPDPKAGVDVKSYRWHGFEVEYTKDEMTEDNGFFNLDRLPECRAQSGAEKDLDVAAYKEAQGLNVTDYQKVGGGGNVYNMVDHFTILTGTDGISRKYLVTVDEKVSEIYRLEEIEAVTDKEKKDPACVPWPIALNHYMPQREDPFGVSIPDLVEDKQRAKSIFKNLRIAAEKANLYPMYMYNRDKILNRRDLDFAFNKFIAVRGDVGAGTIAPINKAPSRTSDSLNNEYALDADVEMSTGASKNAQGVMSEQQRTLGEQEIVQANANLRYALGSKINAWGERRLWKLWYRLYQQNFKGTDKKVIRIQSALGAQYSTITRKLFITSQDPDIRIASKLETEQQRSKERLSFAAIAPLFMADPTLPVSSRNFTKRHLLRLNGLAPEQIQIMVPNTPDETFALMENELLSRNNTTPEIKIEEDHLSHIVIHSQAEKTDATMGHINAHTTAYYESGQAEQDNMMKQQMAMAGNQAMGATAGANANANAQATANNKPVGIQSAG